VNIEIDKIVGNRVFMNKIWNGANFFFDRCKEEPRTKLNLQDKWILIQTENLIKESQKDLEEFRFGDLCIKLH